MDFTNKLRRFSQKYAATYRDTGKKQRYATRAALSLKKAQAQEYPGVTYKVDEEPIIAIEMPESALRTLVDFCEQMEKTNFNQYVLQMLERKEKDAQVRHRNAGVREAYERYKVLLELAR